MLTEIYKDDIFRVVKNSHYYYFIDGEESNVITVREPKDVKKFCAQLLQLTIKRLEYKYDEINKKADKIHRDLTRLRFLASEIKQKEFEC